jgi:hypothetical protein
LLSRHQIEVGKHTAPLISLPRLALDSHQPAAIVKRNIVRMPIAEREQGPVASLKQRGEHNTCGHITYCACVPHAFIVEVLALETNQLTESG